jgi:parallel beta-helix repeat protein
MEELKIKNKLTILLGIFLILILISGIGSAAEIIVQPGNSIQTAVNNSNSGDTITIKPGTYTENIKITKGNLTIKSESGNPDNTIIKAKSSTVNVFFVQADNVKISGIKAIGASGSSYSGIYLSGCNKCVIENNKLMSNGRGIYVASSKGCTISKNTLTGNGYYGIVLGSCTGTTISGNTASNDARGIHVGSSDDNTLSGNTVTSNSAYGIYVCGLSDRNRIYNNYFNNTNVTIKSGTGNSYNTTKTAGKNIVGGSYLGGNYWGKPDGSGFSDTAVDKNGDGISDSAYTSITNSIYSDYLPLAKSSSPAALHANFTSNVTSGTAPLNVLFTDTSTGTPTSWKWDFGDGTNSTIKSPAHTYSAKGNYTVTLTASNAAGSNTTTKTKYITVTGTAVTTKPVADFTGNVTSGTAPLNVAFTDKSTNNPTSWKWTFGDGTNSTSKNPTHKYSTAGKYTVVLTASNSAGNNTTTKTNYITAIGNTSTKPVAAFSASPTSGNSPLNVTFTDSSTGTPTSWKWSFGDGGSSTEKSPKHTYSAAGNYTVSLTSTNAAGNNTTTKTNYIKVTGTAVAKPVLNYWGSPRSGTAPLTVYFKDNSSNSPTAWNWSFGDGTSSTLQNPKHIYSAAGSYTIKLTVTNIAGNTSTTKYNYIVVSAA